MSDKPEISQDVKDRAQEFFQRMADEMVRPHYGQAAKEMHRAVLIRAEEAGLYVPAGR